ncbi:unnamed protein product, partial [Dicrocoelium dendriticum]
MIVKLTQSSSADSRQHSSITDAFGTTRTISLSRLAPQPQISHSALAEPTTSTDHTFTRPSINRRGMEVKPP